MPRNLSDRDPFDVPRPFERKEEKPDFRREFWRELPDMRPTTGHEVPATMYACRFDPQNKRVLHIRGGCPHFPEE